MNRKNFIGLPMFVPWITILQQLTNTIGSIRLHHLPEGKEVKTMEPGVGEGSLQTGKALLKQQVRRANGKYVRGMLKRDKILYIMLIPGIIFYILFHYVPMY